jgi:CheY-like chemotaxis protein
MSIMRKIEVLEQQLEQRTRELEFANMALSRLLAASHDLRQPLHALGLFVAQLRDHIGEAEPDGTRLVDKIDAAVFAMNEQINMLLDIANSNSRSGDTGILDKSTAPLIPSRGPLDVASGKLVLVIDDDGPVLDSTCGLLRSWGCSVVSVDSVGALTNLIGRRQSPDLIIADLHLSNGETGIEAIATMRHASNKAIPAFLVSADTSSEATRDAHSKGYQLLAKPVDPMSLRAILTRMFKTKKFPDEAR